MPDTAIQGPPAGPSAPAGALTGQDRIALLRLMARARALERLRRRRGSAASGVTGWHGEAIGAAAARALGPEDRLIAPGRYLAAHLEGAAATPIGRAVNAPDLVPIAVGIAAAVKARAPDAAVLTLLDGRAMAGERWRAAMRMATEARLPLVLLVERPHRPLRDPGDERAEGAMADELADARDPEEILAAVVPALEQARAGGGPRLVVCVHPSARTLRRRRFAPPATARSRDGDDPVSAYARRLARGRVSREEIAWALETAEDEVTAWTR